MTPGQKQAELERFRTIVLATLDFLVQHFGGSFVYDQYDPVTEYYQQQKIQTEKYFRQRRLDRLQQRLVGLTKALQGKDIVAFTTYIKEKTGFDIDTLDHLRKRVSVTVRQNEIRSQKEWNDAIKMLNHLQESPGNGNEVEKLKSLLANYSQPTNGRVRTKKDQYPEERSRQEKDGKVQVTVKLSTGRKPKHFEKQEAVSPDGKRRLRVVQWSDGKQASTYVAVEFPRASGTVYVLIGIYPDVKASWKDNFTIVIKTNKEYKAHLQINQVRSFDDVISIEYVEH